MNPEIVGDEVTFGVVGDEVTSPSVGGERLRKTGSLGKIRGLVTSPPTIILALLLVLLTTSALAAAPQGSLPLSKDGRPLNLDFEDGTLKDWTATGTAFEKQPIKGDTIPPRRSDMKSQHQGNFWIGTYEIAGDAPQGTLTSLPFKVTQPFAAFLIGGGSHAKTRVELVRADNQQPFFKASGNNSENMRPVVVDLKEQQGKEIFIRLIDQESGGWGHINFDDFRFYAQRPVFANEFEIAKAANANELPPIDQLKFAGLSPEDAAKEMTLPPGFTATLFAGEPDVKQPIAFAIDDRGRLWVAEAYTYPIRATEGQGKDRILVFEDTNGDGKFDKRTVFMEGLNLVSGLEVGFGGVWVGAAPQLMFIPIADGDEPKPAGPPEVLLDGWAYQDTHETLNTFTWGPDGWLYGCQGVFTHSNVGKPGAPDSERTKLNAGVWRLHPTRRVFELFAEGTSNPWGIDFDEHGQCIVEACVIPHLFHMVQGGRFTRQAGSHFDPYTYDDIKTFADHLHWAGNQGPHAGNSRSASAGGGHAHAGMLIYQGDAWPQEFQGKLFMNNIHGACINMDIPERKGSGFVGHHAPNFIEFNDSWSQIINLEQGPDGSVYTIDWYDKNQCHHNDPNGHDRTNGRIFKVAYGKPNPGPVNLNKAKDEDLVFDLLNKNIFVSRHARRLLQERAAAGKLHAQAAETARQLLGIAPRKLQAKLTSAALGVDSELGQLRLLWGLRAMGAAKEADLLKLLSAKGEYVRAWAIQFLCEEKNASAEALKQFARLAGEDRSPVVRLYLASALQRVAPPSRWEVVAKLETHAEDATDHNLPLMVWYAAEPMPTVDAKRALAMAETAKLPNLLNFTVRRTAALNTPSAIAAITELLKNAVNESEQLDILGGLSSALKGQRKASMPEGWADVENKLGASGNAEVQALSLTFGSANAVTALKKTLMDKSADAAARRMACDSLLAVKEPGMAPVLQGLLSDPELQGPALRGLAAYDDAKTASAILTVYPSLNDQHKRDALSTLASRAALAKPLVAAVASGGVPRKDLSAELVRQLRTLKNADLNQELEKVWGVMRESAADKQKEIAKFKAVFQAGGSQPGNASRGRGVFAKTCQQCHTLFDTGGKVGPDLTGSNRGDLDYVLQNIVDPNAVIPNDYKAWNLQTKDDRLITGILKQQDDKAVTLVTANETLVIPRNEIESLTEGQLSMMPEGLLQNLPDQEVRDLIYYLRGPAQAPMPAGAESAAELFNGKDLSNWDGDFSLWNVENGEIVGKTASGLKHNEFLKSKLPFEDFRLVLKVKLVPNKENSGVQFRSEKFGEFEMKGPQADIGAGWWGKLYEENGRALLWNKPGDGFVKTED
ncbi:MAG TPA: PVC-type heme-binding CxxCH protein, partial [Candidatus Dormibacteraeota bacterium]|nr:PVC-type heme-binding CxxCH protein [Candidatus Dormibacteraeota bacterium]